MKSVLFFENLPPEFDQQKVYIMANRNITLKGAAISLASNDIQIFKNYTIELEIEVIAMIARTKQ